MKFTKMVVVLSLGVVVASTANSLAKKSGKENDIENGTVFQIPFESINGENTSLEKYRGKVILVVNVASKCGFTPQYEDLEKLYEKYQDQGLVILGFPANDFLNQEPGTNEEILSFCRENYGVTFPMMSKISVKGKKIHPLYKYLVSHSPDKKNVSWNFNKFLIDRQGNVLQHFGSKTKPLSDDVTGAIEAAL